MLTGWNSYEVRGRDSWKRRAQGKSAVHRMDYRLVTGFPYTSNEVACLVQIPGEKTCVILILCKMVTSFMYCLPLIITFNYKLSFQ